LQNRIDALGKLHGVFGFAALHQHCELITAEPRHRVGRSDLAAKPVGNLLEQQVSRIMTECVVELFEVVKIDVQLRKGWVFGRRAILSEPSLLGEAAAIGQVGQRIMQRQMLQGDLVIAQ
jgi:hypothetical protein